MLQKLTISNAIDRQEFIKFLGVLLNKNLNWKEYIKYTESKIAKNVGLLYKGRPFLERNPLLDLYYSHVQTYINYANIAWASSYRTREIFKEHNILNIYQPNILSNIIFIHLVENKTASSIFLARF